MQITVRRMMGAVSVVAQIITGVQPVDIRFSSLPFMHRVSLPRIGEQVVTCRRVRVTTTGGGYDVPAGARYVVVSESAWDDDSCYTRRSIRFRLLDGPHRGDTVVVGRDKV